METSRRCSQPHTPCLPQPPWGSVLDPALSCPSRLHSQAEAEPGQAGSHQAFFSVRKQSCSSLLSSPLPRVCHLAVPGASMLGARHERKQCLSPVNNQLISQGCEGQREQHEGKSSANTRVCFRGACTDTALGAAGEIPICCDLTWLETSAAAPALHLQQHCLVFLPEHRNCLPSQSFPRLSSPRGVRLEI